MMQLHLFTDAEEFRAHAEPFLLKHEAHNNLIFGIARAVSLGRYAESVLAILETDGAITAVAVMTPPFPLVLAVASQDATRALARELHAAGIVPAGVNGPTAQARAFAEQWAERSGSQCMRKMQQRIYSLHHVRPPVGVPGALRVAHAGDADFLGSWLQGFAADALGEQTTIEHALRTVRNYISDERSSLVLWDVDGASVAMAAASGPTPNGIRVSAVYTPPKFRRHGYAGACVAALSSRLLADGYRYCFLYTDLANPTSNKIYQQIGYEPVCDIDVYEFTNSLQSSQR